MLDCTLAPAAVRDKAFDLLFARNHLAATAAPAAGEAQSSDRKDLANPITKPDSESEGKIAAQNKPRAEATATMTLRRAEQRPPQTVLVEMKAEQLVTLLADLQNHPDQFVSGAALRPTPARCGASCAAADPALRGCPTWKQAEGPASAGRDDDSAGSSAKAARSGSWSCSACRKARGLDRPVGGSCCMPALSNRAKPVKLVAGTRRTTAIERSFRSEKALIFMSNVTIRVRPNGPLLIEGPVTIVDQNGNSFPLNPDKPAVALCRCGHSARRRFATAPTRPAGLSRSRSPRPRPTADRQPPNVAPCDSNDPRPTSFPQRSRLARLPCRR